MAFREMQLDEFFVHEAVSGKVTGAGLSRLILRKSRPLQLGQMLRDREVLERRRAIFAGDGDQSRKPFHRLDSGQVSLADEHGAGLLRLFTSHFEVPLAVRQLSQQFPRGGLREWLGRRRVLACHRRCETNGIVRRGTFSREELPGRTGFRSDDIERSYHIGQQGGCACPVDSDGMGRATIVQFVSEVGRRCILFAGVDQIDQAAQYRLVDSCSHLKGMIAETVLSQQ